MEISNLLKEKYSKNEYNELIKFKYIKKQNEEMIEKFININNLYTQTINSIQTELTENKKKIIKLNEMFCENTKFFNHILTNLIS